MITGYLTEIEKLNARLIESDQMYQQLKKSMNSPRNNINFKNNISLIDGMLKFPEKNSYAFV